MSKKDKHSTSYQQDVSIDDYLAADAELKALRKEHGIEEKEGKLSHLISSFFERRDAREKVLLNKKKHLLLAIFTGWFGGHRFHAHQYVLGVLYLVFFWTGVPMAMTIIDLMQIIPIPADENGDILI
ncbi:MAG: TM2 domain-containing protein [Evtepia sp.]